MVQENVRTTLVLALLTAACIAAAPPARETGDGAAAAPSPGPEPDLRQAQFFARTQGTAEQLELQAESFTAQVETGPQAIHTHLSITMKNPGNGRVEAVMRLPIPPGAAVTRAVLWVGNNPMEGAFVARERARAVYQAITERRRDPALITWSSPEWIDATVFPVEANDRRKLELEWIEPAAAANGKIWYRVPVLAQQGRQVTRPHTLSVDGQTVIGQDRAWLALPAPRNSGNAAVAREPGNPFGYAFAPAEPQERTQVGAPTRIVLVAETSRAMLPEDRKRQSQALDGLLAALPAHTELDLLAVDWRARTLADAESPSMIRRALDALDAIPSAGALDLQNALLAASDRARARHASRIVFLGHGLDAFRGDATALPLQRMQEAGQILIVMGADRASAPIVDAAALTGGQSLPWSQASHVAQLLSAVERTPASLALDSAEPFFPLETVTSQTRWLARFIGQAPAGVARGAEQDLEALWTRAHVAGTADRERDQGQRHRVLTPLTSILVLETVADYARWGIPAPGTPEVPHEQGALGALREVNNSHFRSIFGRDTALGVDPDSHLGGMIGNGIGEGTGVGGLGLAGTGGRGVGTIGLENFGTIGIKGYGRGPGGLGGRLARAPQVLPGPAEVRGSLDKEIIRRLIRQHLNEVKDCYDMELSRKPSLQGRVTVQFTIAATGQVIAAVVQSSTLSNARVESCVVNAVRRWAFLKPNDGGIAIVSYPFNFTAGAGAPPEPAQAMVAPSSFWDTSASILRERSDLPSRVAKVAEAVSAPKETRPALLAWLLVEHHLRPTTAPVAAYLVIANLLKEANSLDDAVRILSEVALFDPDLAAAELCRWGQLEDDAKRVEALKSRGER